MQLRLVILADQPAGIRTRRVEISQGDRPQPECPIDVPERAFDGELRLAIWVYRFLWMRFVDRNSLGLPERRRRRRKHERPDAGAGQCFEQCERADHIGAVIAERIAHRLADAEPRGKVHHRRRPGGAQDLRERRAVEDVAPDQSDLPPRPSRRDPRHGLGMACRQVVVDDDVVACRSQREDGVAADVARAAGDDDGAHARPIDE